MRIKSHISDRETAIETCEHMARESGRKFVLMEYIVDEAESPARFTHCIISDWQWGDLPLGPGVKTQTPHGLRHLMYAGYSFGPDGRL
jgi:hypothetical protein